MNERNFHDKIGRQLEPLGVLSVSLQDERQYFKVLVLGLPAKFYAHLGELDLILVADHRVLIDAKPSVVDELTVPNAKIMSGLFTLSEDCYRRSDVAFVARVLQMVAYRFEHSNNNHQEFIKITKLKLNKIKQFLPSSGCYITCIKNLNSIIIINHKI